MMTSKKTILLLAGAAVLALGAGGVALADRGMMRGEGMGMGPMPAFGELDADKDGSVTEAEVTAFFAAELAKADTNADGKLDAAEMVAWHQARMQERMAERATRMIGMMDGDGDGMLTAEELAAGPVRATMFDRIDADGDGAITEDEAGAMRERMGGRMGRGGHGGGMGGGFFGMEN